MAHRVLPAALAVVACVAAFPAAATAGHNVTLNVSDDEPIERCDQVQVRFGDDDRPLPIARGERKFVLQASATPLLTLHLEGRGGMSIAGWGGKDYEVTACMAAGDRSESAAAKIVGAIDVGFEGGRLAVDGPEGDDWMVYLLVRVPKDAALDVFTGNAPIDLRDVSGRITARTANGPISLARCTGTIDVEARNGPVSVASGGGRHHLQVTNGPLAIVLKGRRWDGDGIEARVDHGPVSLTFPDSYESGVRVTMSGHSPLICQPGACDEADRMNSGASRSLQFGSSPPIIRVSAGNGPVAIQNGGGGGVSI